MKRLIALSFFVFNSVGCKEAVQPPPVERVFAPQVSLQHSAGIPEFVDFNLDGTLSMKGFATANEGQFQQLLQDLDRSLKSIWTAEKIRYRRFGEMPETISTQPFYKAASDPLFFQGSNNYQKTEIENVFKDSGGRLCLVMTDLFEQDSDFTSIQQALKNASFPERASLAIWQWKMPFNGAIFDFDIRVRAGKAYNGGRYLYMLALGPQESIKSLRTAISQRQTAGIGDPKFLLLSDQLTERSADWLTVVHSENLARVGHVVGDRGATPYLVYQLSSTCPSTADLALKSSVRPASDGLTRLADPGSYEASLYSLSSNAKNEWTTRELGNPSVSTTKDKLIRLSVNCAELSKSPLSILRLTRTWAGESIALPDWVENSSATAMEFRDVQKMSRADWGEKTLNLAPFVMDLAAVATRGRTMGSAYIYLVKN